jgi:DNA-binding NarL/FixJ family response regulator
LLETSFGTVVMVADEASLLDAAIRLQPEVAVVDLSLSRNGSLGWLQALRMRCPELKVIVLSVHDEQSVRRAVMEAGADAFVLKRAIASDLLSAVDAVRCSRSVEVSSDNRRPEQEPGIDTGFQDARRDAKSSSVK